MWELQAEVQYFGEAKGSFNTHKKNPLTAQNIFILKKLRLLNSHYFCHIELTGRKLSLLRLRLILEKDVLLTPLHLALATIGTGTFWL